MAEYLAPGVYVEEYDASPRPIAGVPTSTVDLVTLAHEMRQVMLRLVPEWPDHNASDPGITLLELMAWLGDAMMYRFVDLPPQGQRAAHRAIAALAALVHARCPTIEAAARPHFFTGRLPDAATLQMEQDYQREKVHLHNRILHGTGIVEGLAVHIERSDGEPEGRVTVTPGYALDPGGKLITVACGATIKLPNADGTTLYVSLRHAEVFSNPVPSSTGGSPLSTIEDVCILALVDDVVPPAISLARLSRAEGRWQVDGSFSPCRLRRTD